MSARRRHWQWLLVIPTAAPLLTPFANRMEPTLVGIPFFFWYQVACALLAMAVITVVYFATRAERPLAPSEDELIPAGRRPGRPVTHRAGRQAGTHVPGWPAGPRGDRSSAAHADVPAGTNADGPAAGRAGWPGAAHADQPGAGRGDWPFISPADRP